MLVAATGIVLSFRQIMRLFPEIKWVNSMQDGTMARVRQPVLLAPVAGMLRDRLGEAVITPSSMRSILDSVGNRLDEAKDTSRYLTGLLVFLGLLGTFYGLLETVTAVSADTIQALNTSTTDTATLFANLQAGPDRRRSSGMGTAFSASLLGLSGSLILGFLDLQTSQAQNAFYTDLEDWMTSMTELDHPMTQMQATGPGRAGRGDVGDDRAARLDHAELRIRRRTPFAPWRSWRAASTGWSSTSAPSRPICASTSKSRATPTRSCAS